MTFEAKPIVFIPQTSALPLLLLFLKGGDCGLKQLLDCHHVCLIHILIARPEKTLQAVFSAPRNQVDM
jgi:hypothetical protein